MLDLCQKPEFHPMFLEEAYDKCRNICVEYAKTFYLGNNFTSLLSSFHQPSICPVWLSP